MITFYDSPMAPNTKRTRMIFAEKSIAYDRKVISIMEGENIKPEFLAINPAGTLPTVITDEGVTLFENMGIAVWAEAAFPDVNLLGETPIEKGEIMSWAQRVDFMGMMAFADAYRNGHPGMKGRAIPGPVGFEQIPELVERGQIRLKNFARLLDDHLADKDYIAAGRFTVADIWAFSLLEVMAWIKMRPNKEDHPHVTSWFARIKERPSAKDNGT